MELRVLRYFLIVAREENITKAANLLHLTQPTLSRQLMQLEDELGVKLFHRTKHSITLTEEGLLLKRRAQEIVSLADKTKQEFLCEEEELTGEIAIGCAETRNMSFLSEKIRLFKTRYPLVHFQIYSAIADDVKERMEQGLIDIGLLTEPVEISKYDFFRLKEKERWGVIVSESDALADKTAVTVNDLLNVPLLMPARQSIQHEVSSWFQKDFENLNVAADYNLILNAANMVRHHVGVALCFDLDFQYDDLRFIPLNPELYTGTIIVWKKNQAFSKVTSRFIQFIRDIN